MRGFGLGTGSLAWAEGKDAFFDAMATAWAGGVRYFDTAPLYLDGASESALGDFLRGRDRDEYRVSSKVGRFAPRPQARAEEALRRFDYSREATRASVELSLQRLGIQRLDTVFVHDVDRLMHGSSFGEVVDEVENDCLGELERMRDEGLIAGIGVSSRQSEVCRRFAADPRVDSLMMAGSYTLLNHEPLSELFPWCREAGVEVIIASPFNAGILATEQAVERAGGPVDDDIRQRKAAMVAVCRAHGVSLPQLALQFPLLHPAVGSIVVGHKNAGEVNSNLEALAREVPGAVWGELAGLGLVPAAAVEGAAEREGRQG